MEEFLKTQSSITTFVLNVNEPLSSESMDYTQFIKSIEEDIEKRITQQNVDYISKVHGSIHYDFEFRKNLIEVQLCLVLAQDGYGGFKLGDKNEVLNLLNDAFKDSKYSITTFRSMAFKDIEEQDLSKENEPFEISSR